MVWRSKFWTKMKEDDKKLFHALGVNDTTEVWEGIFKVLVFILKKLKELECNQNQTRFPSL